MPVVPQVVFTGQKVRMQAVYCDSRSLYSALGVMVTSEVWLSGVGQDHLLVEFVGEDSFSINQDGFFRIHYLGGPAIDVVKLDFRATTSNSDLLDAWFDADQTLFDQGTFDPRTGGLLGWMGLSRA